MTLAARTRLLVSVRTAAEARTAMSGGADIIDVKEPSGGSLGMARPEVWSEVAAAVEGTELLLTAALGELGESEPRPIPPRGFGLLKVGLAGCGTAGWQDRWRSFWGPFHGFGRVAVAYADWQRSAAPAPDEVAQLAIDERADMLLVDTWAKDGHHLLDWLAEEHLHRLKLRLGVAGVGLALAGSLGIPQIERILPMEPDVIAVRGAVCRGGRRDGEIDVEAVRELASLVRTTRKD